MTLDDWEISLLNLTRTELRLLGSDPEDRDYTYEQEMEMRRALPGLAARHLVEITGDSYSISPALHPLLPALRELEKATRSLEPPSAYGDWQVLNRHFKKGREQFHNVHGSNDCSCTLQVVKTGRGP